MIDLYAIGFDPILRNQDYVNWLPDENAPVATGGGKALINATEISKSLLLDVLTAGKVNGAAVFGHPMADHAFLSMALLDSKSGDVLWYNFEFSKKKTKYNLLDADSAEKMVEKVLSKMEEE